MTRKISHTQVAEPMFEYVLSWLRFKKAEKYIKKNSVVADLGCGYNAQFLSRIAPFIKTGVGYDVDVTKNGLPKNIILKKSDLDKKIDSKKSYYNCLTALAVLEHVENPEKFITKAKAMLQKNGELIITTPHKRLKLILEILSSVGLVSKGEIEDHKTYFTNKTLKKLLKSQGLKVVRLETFELGFNLFALARKS
jgi:ubiquinone/menaquinone biosynthesis C-methylase UbiE